MCCRARGAFARLGLLLLWPTAEADHAGPVGANCSALGMTPTILAYTATGSNCYQNARCTSNLGGTGQRAQHGDWLTPHNDQYQHISFTLSAGLSTVERIEIYNQNEYVDGKRDVKTIEVSRSLDSRSSYEVVRSAELANSMGANPNPVNVVPLPANASIAQHCAWHGSLDPASAVPPPPLAGRQWRRPPFSPPCPPRSPSPQPHGRVGFASLSCVRRRAHRDQGGVGRRQWQQRRLHWLDGCAFHWLRGAATIRTTAPAGTAAPAPCRRGLHGRRRLPSWPLVPVCSDGLDASSHQ